MLPLAPPPLIVSVPVLFPAVAPFFKRTCTTVFASDPLEGDKSTGPATQPAPPTFISHVAVSDSASRTAAVVKWLPLTVVCLVLLPTYPSVETNPVMLLCVDPSVAAGTDAVTVNVYVFVSQTKLTVSVFVTPADIAAAGVNVTVKSV